MQKIQQQNKQNPQNQMNQQQAQATIQKALQSNEMCGKQMKFWDEDGIMDDDFGFATGKVVEMSPHSGGMMQGPGMGMNMGV